MPKKINRNANQDQGLKKPVQQRGQPSIQRSVIDVGLAARQIQELTEHKTARSQRQANLLQLQRQFGNSYVNRLLAREDHRDTQTGKPSKQSGSSEPRVGATAVHRVATNQLQRFDLFGGIIEGIKKAYRKMMLSGAHWKDMADAMGWSYSTSLDDLEDPFKTNVTNFIAALKAAGANVHIETTRRSKKRAWLMHHAWRVAHGKRPPKDDPYGSGIIWDHGTRKKTKAGARAMISRAGFNMAFPASLTSLHIRGKAIDMTITNLPKKWTFTHKGKTVKVNLGKPNTGQNPRLHRAAAKYFKVKKLKKDPPHWSISGK